MLCESFAPIIKNNARVLILGSMPSQVSLEKHQYYGNPRNHFWPIIYTVLDHPLSTSYDQRVQDLMENRIALWDVLSRCNREGSLDSSIKDESANDFTGLINTFPTLKLVCFNGSKASLMWKKHVHFPTRGLDFITLPSSSPMVGKNVKSLAEKIESWKMLRNYL